MFDTRESKPFNDWVVVRIEGKYLVTIEILCNIRHLNQISLNQILKIGFQNIFFANKSLIFLNSLINR